MPKRQPQVTESLQPGQSIQKKILVILNQKQKFDEITLLKSLLQAELLHQTEGPVFYQTVAWSCVTFAQKCLMQRKIALIGNFFMKKFPEKKLSFFKFILLLGSSRWCMIHWNKRRKWFQYFAWHFRTGQAEDQTSPCWSWFWPLGKGWDNRQFKHQT